MKRSTINAAFAAASEYFERHHRYLPPRARWDITDFGLGDFRQYGLTLVNLATQPEYCEKLMYAQRGQITPCHTHFRKKEDISRQVGELTLQLWPEHPARCIPRKPAEVAFNGEPVMVAAGIPLVLRPGSRVTLRPGTWHAFYPTSDECIIAEVSTANDDLHDNVFAQDDIGRFPGIEEDAPSVVRIISDPSLST
jgi:D-lyxose ketol-isomerase